MQGGWYTFIIETMAPVTQVFEFRGTASQVAPGALALHATAPSGDGTEALLDASLSFVGEEHFEERGSFSFGGLDAVQFRSLGPGHLVQSADPELQHGVALLEVVGGSGAFALASGRVVSNFLLSTTGELTDRSVAVIFQANKETA
jgi:hypothetical protein